MGEKHPLLKFLAFAAVCVAFAVWIVAVIGNISFEGRKDYAAVFTDVQGLLVNDDVKVSGVSVGKVNGLEVRDGKAIVHFEVREDLRLGEDTRIDVRWRSILGQRFVYIVPSGSGDLPPGHEFPDEVTTEPANIGTLVERLTPVMNALDPQLSNQVVEALGTALLGRTDEVRELIRDGASLTQALADRDDEIGSLLSNAGTVMDAYATQEAQLRALLDSFAEVAETVAARNDALEGTIIDLADVQAEFRRLIETNDGEIRGTLEALDGIAAVLSVNHDRVEELATYMFEGVVAYHEISRWGQWFNINVLIGSSAGEPFSIHPDAEVKPAGPQGSAATQAAMRRFFGFSQVAALAEGGR